MGEVSCLLDVFTLGLSLSYVGCAFLLLLNLKRNTDRHSLASAIGLWLLDAKPNSSYAKPRDLALDLQSLLTLRYAKGKLRQPLQSNAQIS